MWGGSTFWGWWIYSNRPFKWNLFNSRPFTHYHDILNLSLISGLSLRAGGRGFSPATKRVAPGYFYWKIEPKEIPSRLIPRLLVVFTRQLEILVTTLDLEHSGRYQFAAFWALVLISIGIPWFAVIFGINTTHDISKLLYVISWAARWVKFETILKYHEWYLCQRSCTNHAIICLHYYPQTFCNFHM